MAGSVLPVVVGMVVSSSRVVISRLPIVVTLVLGSVCEGPTTLGADGTLSSVTSWGLAPFVLA